MFHVEQTWAMRDSGIGQDGAIDLDIDQVGAAAPVVVRRRSFLVVPAPL